MERRRSIHSDPRKEAVPSSPSGSASSDTDWPIVAVVGAGAVGCYFGGMLARAGAPVTFLGRPGSKSPHMQAIRERGVRIDGTQIQETIPVEVGEGPEAVASAELVLYCVKTLDTETAAAGILPHLRDDAVVVSLQNGVDNVDRLRTVGIDAIPTVVFVAAAIETPGTVKHRGRGDLVIGPQKDRSERQADAERVAAWFERADVPCPVSDDIRRDQWLKLILNSMTNATSALTGTSYRRLADFEPTWNLALAIAREALDVAAADGSQLDLEEIVTAAHGVISKIGEATSSTQQDIAAGRRTEIDSLNGYIARRGAELGVPTPANEAIWALVKLREEADQNSRMDK